MFKTLFWRIYCFVFRKEIKKAELKSRLKDCIKSKHHVLKTTESEREGM